MSCYSLLIVIVVFGFFATSPVQARWASQKEAFYQLNKQFAQVELDEDGTYVYTSTDEFEILKEQGKSRFTPYSLSFNEGSTELEILEAKVINFDGEYEVSKKHITTKAAGKQSQAFDSLMMTSIAFPKLQVGSKIRIKIRYKVKKVPVRSMFDIAFVWGAKMPERASRGKLISEVPLYYHINDPGDRIQFKKYKKGGKYIYEVQNKIPEFNVSIGNKNVLVNPKQIPWIEFSSQKDWSLISKTITPKFEEVIAQDSPKSYKAIIRGAKKIKKLEDQINYIASRLNSKITYFGDWRSIEGSFHPRDLTTVDDSRFGDCKDYSAALVKILRALGRNAYVALTKRANLAVRPYTSWKVARFSYFNHAIVAVEHKGKTFWIDPTNYSSFGLQVRSDISSRNALILKPNESAVTRIPKGIAKNYYMKLAKDIDFQSKSINVSGNVKLSGRAAEPFTGLGKLASKKTIDNALIKIVQGKDIPYEESVNVNHLGFVDKIVKPLSFSYSYSAPGKWMTTSAGSVYELPNRNFATMFSNLKSDEAGDLFLGETIKVDRIYTLTNLKIIGKLPQGCHIKNDWVEVHRKLKKTKKGVKIGDRVIIKKNWISHRELKSKAFHDMARTMEDCYYNAGFLFKPLNRRKLRMPASIGE